MFAYEELNNFSFSKINFSLLCIQTSDNEGYSIAFLAQISTKVQKFQTGVS